jgi:hypothetical protein
MARRNSTNAPSDTENTEATASESEAPEKDDTPVDLTAFNDAVAEAVAEADKSTGEVPEASIAKANEAYRALDGIKAKNAARADLDKRMMDAIFESDAPLARSYAQIKENLSAGSSSSSKAPKDPTENFIGKLAGLQAAFTLLFNDAPEGVKDGWQDQVETKASELAEAAAKYRTDLSNATDESPFDDSDVPSDVKRVVKLATGKTSGGSGYTGGPRRNVGKHIEQVFADLPVGSVLTVTEINKARSEEYGPNDAPTTGAISQRLFPPKGGKPNLPEGIEPVNDEGSPRGARKVA